jgi:hypothetical protein
MTILTASSEIAASISERGFAVVRGASLQFLGLEHSWRKLMDDWTHLEIDNYMSDGGRYRLRRFGRFLFEPRTKELLRLPHSTVFQSRYVNNFAGGIHRSFAPLRETTFENLWLRALIHFDFGCFPVTKPERLAQPWEVWIHQIRIQTNESAVHPAPEGIHHDGHDFIAMHLVNRQNVRGGRSVLYDNSKNELHSCTLEGSLDTIYADDHRVMHAVSPISPEIDGISAQRDILILDFDFKPGLLRPGGNPNG